MTNDPKSSQSVANSKYRTVFYYDIHLEYPYTMSGNFIAERVLNGLETKGTFQGLHWLSFKSP